MTLNAWNSDDVNHHCKGAREQQVEPVLAPEDGDNSIVTVLQWLTTAEVIMHRGNALATILDVVKEAVKQLFYASKLRAQEEFHTVV